MFTGLIEDVGMVRQVERRSGGLRLLVATQLTRDEQQVGASLAVNGVCLTATGFTREGFAADLSPESLQRSTLETLRPGDLVNLERALRFGDRLGGHLVTGHVDGIGTVTETLQEGNAVIVRLRLPRELVRYVAVKGSIAVDGVSLTVNQLEEDRIGLAVIPHTWRATSLHRRPPGARVNIEIDLLARYVERLLAGGVKETGSPAIDREFLSRHGFN